jgi:predicted GNAT family N-acyltransferase
VNLSKLQSFHKREFFECEEPSLTHYLKKQARQDERKKLAVCFVAANQQDEVIGYYTLSTQSLSRRVIPDEYSKLLPRNYHVPLILLGRLARHSDERGNGLGEILLLDALKRSLIISERSLGAFAVVVDPINEHARAFYAQFEFIELLDSKKMFLPMKTIKKLF